MRTRTDRSTIFRHFGGEPGFHSAVCRPELSAQGRSSRLQRAPPEPDAGSRCAGRSAPTMLTHRRCIGTRSRRCVRAGTLSLSLRSSAAGNRCCPVRPSHWLHVTQSSVTRSPMHASQYRQGYASCIKRETAVPNFSGAAVRCTDYLAGFMANHDGPFDTPREWRQW